MLTAVFSLLARLPLRAVHAIGAAGGWLTYLLSASYRMQVRANLAQAGLNDASLRRRSVAEAGRQALEAAWLWQRPAADIAACVNEALVGSYEELLADPRPLMILTPHLGGFEAVAQYYATRAAAQARPMTALYRVPRKQALRALIDKRARPGLLLAPADMCGVRMLMRALKSGQTVGILPDQVPSQGDGVWAPFFGRPAYTMTLPARLAATLNARIVFVVCERQPGGRGYTLRLTPFEQPLTGDITVDTMALNQAVETLIRQYPAQYLWGYKRYKAPAGVSGPATEAEAAP